MIAEQSLNMSDSNQVRVALRASYSDTYKNIPVTAFNVSTSEKGIELTAYVDEEDLAPIGEIVPNTVYVKRTIETRLTINPYQAKALVKVIEDNIKNYESVFGKLASQEEIQQRVLEKQTQSARKLPQNTSSTKPTVGIQ